MILNTQFVVGNTMGSGREFSDRVEGYNDFSRRPSAWNGWVDSVTQTDANS